MATATKTVTINAAFLQEIKQDNERLYDLLHEIWMLCSVEHAQSAEPERFSELLADLRDQLALHFTLEEVLGYFNDPADVEPDVCQRAEWLRSQHVNLYRDAVSLADDATALVYPGTEAFTFASLLDRVRRFHAAIQLHESRESDLICEVHHRGGSGEG